MKNVCLFVSLLLLPLLAIVVGRHHLRAGARNSLQQIHAPAEELCPPALQTHRMPIQRTIFIGDIHGAAAGLRELLVSSGIINRTRSGCRRLKSPPGTYETVVVQLGDLVDRGKFAHEAWDCLDELQQTSSPGTVVRLAGNHELMWLEGRYFMSRDSPPGRAALTLRIREAILSGVVVGAAALANGQLLVTHAGMRRPMLTHLQQRMSRNNDEMEVPMGTAGGPTGHNNKLVGEDVHKIADMIRQDLVSAATRCHPRKQNEIGARSYEEVQRRRQRSSPHPSPLICEKDAFVDEVFSAGPERGGDGVGGPFWTDFSVVKDSWRVSEKGKAKYLHASQKNLAAAIDAVGEWFFGQDSRDWNVEEKDKWKGRTSDLNSSPNSTDSTGCAVANENNLLACVTQVVGHSAARCDVHEDPYGCQPIRSAPRAFAVDGAMFWGNRAYLELTTEGHFLSHTKAGQKPVASNGKAKVSHSAAISPRMTSYSSKLFDDDLSHPEAPSLWITRNLTAGSTCGVPVNTQWAITTGEIFTATTSVNSSNNGQKKNGSPKRHLLSAEQGNGTTLSTQHGRPTHQRHSIRVGSPALLFQRVGGHLRGLVRKISELLRLLPLPPRRSPNTITQTQKQQL